MPNQPPMSQDEMLAKMGISADDFKGYLNAYAAFYNALNTNQQAFHRKNAPAMTVDAIAHSLGPYAQPADVQNLFYGAPGYGTTYFVRCC
jgi:hypothetical protein